MKMSFAHNLPFALYILFIACCSQQAHDQSDRLIGFAPDQEVTLQRISLGTGKKYRLKGLAIDPKNQMAYLGSWDQKVIVSVSLIDQTCSEINTPYNGKLNGMGTYLKGNRLYAVMNEVDDRPDANAISALVIIDLVNGELIGSYESVGKNGRNHFNHVVVDDQGVAYVSNTLKSNILTVDTNDASDSLKVFLEDSSLSWVHGIDLNPDNNRLFTTAYKGGIRIVDLQTGRFLPYRNMTHTSNDGLKYYRGSLYGVGHNTLIRYQLSKEEDDIIKIDTLLHDHEYFNDPRCLHIESGWLYCLANIDYEPGPYHQRKTPLNDSYLVKLRVD